MVIGTKKLSLNKTLMLFVTFDIECNHGWVQGLFDILG